MFFSNLLIVRWVVFARRGAQDKFSPLSVFWGQQFIECWQKPKKYLGTAIRMLTKTWGQQQFSAKAEPFISSRLNESGLGQDSSFGKRHFNWTLREITLSSIKLHKINGYLIKERPTWSARQQSSCQCCPPPRCCHSSAALPRRQPLIHILLLRLTLKYQKIEQGESQYNAAHKKSSHRNARVGVVVRPAGSPENSHRVLSWEECLNHHSGFGTTCLLCWLALYNKLVFLVRIPGQVCSSRHQIII